MQNCRIVEIVLLQKSRKVHMRHLMTNPHTHTENRNNEGLLVKFVPGPRWELKGDRTIILYMDISFLIRSYLKIEESIEELPRGLHTVKDS